MPTKRTIRRRLTKRQNHRCLACKKRVPFLTLDHVKAKAKGGTTIMRNLQGLCFACNTKKGDRYIDYRH